MVLSTRNSYVFKENIKKIEPNTDLMNVFLFKNFSKKRKYLLNAEQNKYEYERCGVL